MRCSNISNDKWWMNNWKKILKLHNFSLLFFFLLIVIDRSIVDWIICPWSLCACDSTLFSSMNDSIWPRHKLISREIKQIKWEDKKNLEEVFFNEKWKSLSYLTSEMLGSASWDCDTWESRRACKELAMRKGKKGMLLEVNLSIF